MFTQFPAGHLGRKRLVSFEHVRTMGSEHPVDMAVQHRWPFEEVDDWVWAPDASLGHPANVQRCLVLLRLPAVKGGQCGRALGFVRMSYVAIFDMYIYILYKVP